MSKDTITEIEKQPNNNNLYNCMPNLLAYDDYRITLVVPNREQLTAKYLAQT
jgi:hypothetical protein